jgi:hypothetical protein
MIEIVTIEIPSLGDRTYLATDGAGALVIDPQRDIDRVLAVAAARGVAVTHVFETHGWPAASRLVSYPVSDFPGLAAAWARQNLTVLDVRRNSERHCGLRLRAAPRAA